MARGPLDYIVLSDLTLMVCYSLRSYLVGRVAVGQGNVALRRVGGIWLRHREFYSQPVLVERLPNGIRTPDGQAQQNGEREGEKQKQRTSNEHRRISMLLQYLVTTPTRPRICSIEHAPRTMSHHRQAST